MTRIFEPLFPNALIYIDDILLFSKDIPSHLQLLQHFFDIVHQHGIMLLEKKSSIGQNQIEFLGMRFSNGQYHPGPHIAEELFKFSDQLTHKEVQQFLGIVNYLKEFIPQSSKHTSLLSQMLRKNATPWSHEQTAVVQYLKKVCQTLPPLKLPGTGSRILQTDASDEHWGEILLEKINDKEFFCGHASGQFKEAEKHYHTVYKEILAIKNGIKRFEFHLIGHEFLVRMDNSSFPRIMEFKNKSLLEAQLLRLKDWFSKYQFKVQHIKGTSNVIPDFLSRPSKVHTPSIHLITPTRTIPLVLMLNPLTQYPNFLEFPPQASRFNSTQ